MDELTLDNKKYLSTKYAAKVTGYAKDYVGQLCREGRVEARLVGRNWYVLEEAILEHRFGDDQETTKQEEPSKTLPEPWNSPRYVAEPAQTIPEITPKAPSVPNYGVPEPVQPAEILSDMQSAWQDWFKQRENEPKELPDASEMLLADHEVSPEKEKTEEMPIAEPDFEEEAVPVHIERHFDPEPAALEPIEVVRITRKSEPLSRPLQRSETSYKARTITRQGVGGVHMAVPSPVMRAIFLSIAGLAIIVTVIGSGVLDTSLEKGSSQSLLTDVFSGTQRISK